MNIKVCFPEKRHFTDFYFDLFHGLRDETLTVYCSRCIVDTVRRTIQNTTHMQDACSNFCNYGNVSCAFCLFVTIYYYQSFSDYDDFECARAKSH